MCRSCRSRQELSNEHLLAKLGVDTAENEYSKVSSFIPTQAISFHIDTPPFWTVRCCERSRTPLAITSNLTDTLPESLFLIYYDRGVPQNMDILTKLFFALVILQCTSR